MNDLEFATFQTVVEVTRKFQTGWRYGQTVWLVLRELRPDLADEVAGTELDTFYHSTRVSSLLNWLRTGVPAVPQRRL